MRAISSSDGGTRNVSSMAFGMTVMRSSGTSKKRRRSSFEAWDTVRTRLARRMAVQIWARA